MYLNLSMSILIFLYSSLSTFVTSGQSQAEGVQSMPDILTVYGFALNGTETNRINFANLTNAPTKPFPDVFTFCFRVLTTFDRYSRGYNYMEIPKRPGETFIMFYQYYNETHTTDRFEGQIAGRSYIRGNFIYERSWYDKHTPKPALRVWGHYCLALDVKAKKLRLYEGGKLRVSALSDWDSFENFVEYKPKSVNGMLLGTHQSKTDRQIFAKYTSVNVFSRFLNDSEMKTITGCKDDIEGDYLNWIKMKWYITGSSVQVKRVPFSNVCPNKTAKSVLFPILVSWARADKTCRKFGGELHTPKNDDELLQFFNYHKDIPILNDGMCHSFQGIWMGYRGEVNPGGSYIVNHYTNETLFPEGWANGTFPFAPGNRKRFLESDEKTDICFEIDIADSYKTSAYSKVCTSRLRDYCVSCVFGKSITINVQGWCKETFLEPSRQFSLHQDDYGFVTLFGNKDSKIEWNSNDKLWNLTMFSKPEVYATTNASLNTFLLGTHNWKIYGDTCAKNGQEKKVTFTRCFMGNNYEDNKLNGRKGEFTCDDGLCIPMDQRCNTDPNCQDLSDEKDCKIVDFGIDYFNHKIPFQMNRDDSIKKVEVNVSVDLKDILEISEVNSIFTAIFDLTIEWHDRRLHFNNLKHLADINDLSKQEKIKLWVPTLLFKNTRNNKASIVDKHTEMKVIRKGNFERKDILYRVKNNYLFKGEENPIFMKRSYSIEFLCDFNMIWYPFNNQKCSMTFTIIGKKDKYINLNPLKMKYFGPNEISQYYIKLTNISKSEYENESDIKVNIIFGRHLINIFLVTYLPTILINIINQVTNYFELSIGDIIQINVNSMIVLSGLYTAVSNNLPATDYVKYIDIWFIFSLTYPFCTIIIQTFLQKAEAKYTIVSSAVVPTQQTFQQKLKNKIKYLKYVSTVTLARFAAQVLLPFCGIVFCLTYLFIGLYVGQSS